MKRSRRESSRAMRNKRGDGQGTSRYAEKVKAGRQMYGPGCCGHPGARRRPGTTRKPTPTTEN